MMALIITIGREYGSGGREIGELVAQKMGVPFYDKEVLTRAAQESGLCPEVFEKNDEKASISGMLNQGGMPDLRTGTVAFGLQMPLNQRIFLAQFDAINKIASEGSCVIVGRCADYVLKDQPDVVRVFFYASLDARIERIRRIEGITRDQARELIRKMDKQRRNYYNFFADGNWGLHSNYDLMVRTDSHRPGDIASAVVAFAREQQA